MKATPADKRRVFTVIRDLDIRRPSEAAALVLPEQADDKHARPCSDCWQSTTATRLSGGDASDWDLMMPYAQAAMTRKDYITSSGSSKRYARELSRTSTRAGRKPGRDMVTQAYSAHSAGRLPSTTRAPSPRCFRPRYTYASAIRSSPSTLTWRT